jgi:preprotein translocase subunit SecG
MVQFLIVLHTLVSILLIFAILMQSGQGGLNSMLSGTANSMLGSTGANDFMTKLTTWLGITFIGLAILIGALSGNKTLNSSSIIQQDAIINAVENDIVEEYALPSGNLIPEATSDTSTE